MHHLPWSLSTRQQVIAYTCSCYEHRFVHGQRRVSWNELRRLRGCVFGRHIRLFTCSSERPLSQRSALHAAEHHNPLTTHETQIPEYSFSIKPKENPLPPKTSQIRDSLRAWSVQNEKAKQNQQLESLPYEGKISTLPNALFLDTDDKNDQNEWRDSGYHEETEEELSYRGGSWLPPGTLIRHSSPSVRNQDAIYLGDIGVQSILLLSSGKWAAERIGQKRLATSSFRGFPIPNFVSPEEIEALRAHMPKQDVKRALQEGLTPVTIDVTGSMPYEVVDPILARMKSLRETGNRFLRDHRLALEQTYDTLAYQDRWRAVSLVEVSSLVLGIQYSSMNDAEKRAFVSWVDQAHPGIQAVQAAQTLTLLIVPKSFDENAKLVQEWARLYQEAAAQAAMGKNVSELLLNNPLASFIEKARRCIVKSRKIRSPTTLGVLGPVIAKDRDNKPIQKLPTGEVFTADDNKIIDYLWDSCARVPISRYSHAHASLITRAVGAYPGAELLRPSFRMLLAELGCIDPWCTVEQIQAPISGTKLAWAREQLRSEAMESAKLLLDPVQRKTVFMDSMAMMRKDWGTMEGFCIDQTSTRIAEDAISVEPAHELDGGYWIHGHVSHPTAHFDLNHPVARMARKQGSSYFDHYVDETPALLLPKAVSSEFSLTNSTAVLTISTLMTRDGVVHDVQVVPATLRNIKCLDRRVAYKALGIEDEDVGSVLVVGKVKHIPGVTDRKRYDEITEKDLQSVSGYLPQLKLIQELLRARCKRRVLEAETPAHLPRKSFKIITRTNLPERPKPDRERESFHWTGDPGIVVVDEGSVEHAESWMAHRADDLTAQAMRLLAESLGKWLSDRNIPAVYLGVDLPPGHSLKELCHPQKGVEMADHLFTRSLLPKPNFVHNMKQHAAGTSPMRRFIDMMSHFQVDSYLKAVANGLVEPGAPVEDDSILAFSRADVQDYLDQDAALSDTLDDLGRQTSRFWAGQAMFRAFHFKEAALPDVMEVNVTEPARRNAKGTVEKARGRLIPFYLNVILTPSPEGYENLAKIDDFLPVRLLEVGPDGYEVIACAVGPPTGERQFVEPLRSYSENNLL